jgi:hypothetical protein
LKERDYVVEQQTKESLPDRYKRLSSEYENLYCNLNEAEQYMLKYVALFEGDPHKMMEIGIFYLRIGKIEKTEMNEGLEQIAEVVSLIMLGFYGVAAVSYFGSLLALAFKKGGKEEFQKAVKQLQDAHKGSDGVPRFNK